jgi:hypothetical protein
VQVPRSARSAAAFPSRAPSFPAQQRQGTGKSTTVMRNLSPHGHGKKNVCFSAFHSISSISTCSTADPMRHQPGPPPIPARLGHAVRHTPICGYGQEPHRRLTRTSPNSVCGAPNAGQATRMPRPGTRHAASAQGSCRDALTRLAAIGQARRTCVRSLSREVPCSTENAAK